jgi:hypothetical protein
MALGDVHLADEASVELLAHLLLRACRERRSWFFPTDVKAPQRCC